MNVAVLEKREEDALTAMWSAYQRTRSRNDEDSKRVLRVSPRAPWGHDVRPETRIPKLQGCVGHDVTTTYSYDSLYRLTRASTTNATTTSSGADQNWLEAYSYNALGNILTKSLNYSTSSYTYAGTNYANTHAATDIGGVTYAYDNAGSVTAIGSNTYTYNYRGRMTDALVAGTSTHYLYDASNQRVLQDARISGGSTSTTKFWNRYFETSGATTTMYIFAGGQLVSTVEGNGTATTTNIVHTDHSNGTNVVSDGGGTQKQLLNYHPFGSLRQNEQTTAFNEKRKSIGEYYDDAVVLNYYNARYMSASVGRFLAQDPMFTGDPNGQKINNPQSLNAYSYAENNPIVKSDPTGLEAYGVSLLSGGGEAGLGVFGGLTFNMSLNYVNGSTPNDSGIALTASFGGTVGFGPYSINYPNTVHSPAAASDATSFVVGRYAGGGCLCPPPLTQVGGSYSPNADKLGDLNGVSSNLTGNTRVGSVSLQRDANGNPTYSGSVFGKGDGASVGNYPIQTVTLGSIKTSTITSAANSVSNAYQAALNGIQAQINNIQAQINALRASISKMGTVEYKASR